jgi:hypothetical protein
MYNRCRQCLCRRDKNEENAPLCQVSLDLNGEMKSREVSRSNIAIENDHFHAPTSSSVECLLLYSLPAHHHDGATNHGTFSFQQNGDSLFEYYVKLP